MTKHKFGHGQGGHEGVVTDAGGPAGGSGAKKKVTVAEFSLATFFAAVVLSNAPATAVMGVDLIGWLLLGAVIVLLPTIYVASELATSFHRNGGMYVWVREAFGPRAGFLAVWFQWLPRVIVIPTIISFIAATLTYGFSPELASSPLFLAGTIVAVTWTSVLLNCLGVRDSVLASTVGALVGNLLPALLLVLLGVGLIFSHGGMETAQTFAATTSANHAGAFSLLTLALASYVGFEVTANYVQTLKDPERNYRRALLGAGGLAVIVMIGAALAVGLVVPVGNLGLVTGVMQAFDVYLTHLGLGWALAPLGIVIGLATVSQASAFTMAPAVGILAAAQDLDMAEPLQHVNKRGAPSRILIIQGLVTTLLAVVFLLAPDTSVAFAMILDLAVVLYMGVYLLMYASAVRLRLSRPDIVSPRPVPGGKLGFWVTVAVGFFGTIGLVAAGLLPSAALHVSNTFYVGFILLGIVVTAAAPFAMRSLRHPMGDRVLKERAEVVPAPSRRAPVSVRQPPSLRPPSLRPSGA